MKLHLKLQLGITKLLSPQRFIDITQQTFPKLFASLKITKTMN
jgi:hypothetical protein